MPDVQPSAWLADSAPLADAAFETDADGQFTGFGGAMLFGHEAAALLGVAAATLFSLPIGLFATILAELSAGTTAWHARLALKQRNGKTAIVRLALTAGPVAGFRGLITHLDSELADFTTRTALPAASPARLLCPETGLWTLASFTDQTARRFDRLDVEGQPGTLMLLGFNQSDPALHTPVAIAIAEELRDIIRPTDLLGRIAPGIIALWCDGMDHLTGAERAARFCKYLPKAVPGTVLISIGLVTRWPTSADDPQSLLARATQSLAKAEDATRREASGQWHVWQKDHSV
ncbi:MAG TPA: hypothetical protein PLT25_00955 [Acidocella sp.]|nr:hypothetical protein [Acidocella sp.]